MKKCSILLAALLIVTACLLSGCLETITITYMYPQLLVPNGVIGKEVISKGSEASGYKTAPEVTVDGITYVFDGWVGFQYGRTYEDNTTVYAKYKVKSINVTVIYIWQELIENGKSNELSKDEIGEFGPTGKFLSGERIVLEDPEYDSYRFVCWQQSFVDRVVYNLKGDERNDGTIILYARDVDIKIYAFFEKTTPST